MQRRMKRLTVLSIALSLVVWAMWMVAREMMPDGAVTQVDPRVFDVPVAVVERIGEGPETGEAARIYRDLIERGPYFAAMAMNPEGGMGWADNHVTLAGAEEFAMAWCAEEGEECRIILRISPEREISWHDQPLSRSAAAIMQDYLAQPGAKALAMTETGGWGVSWAQSSRQAAEVDALRQCATREVTRAPGLERRATCRMIWVD